MKYILAIDPGQRGALCFYCLDTQRIIFYPMPLDTSEHSFKIDCPVLKEIIKAFPYPIEKVFIEKVHAMPGQGVASMFNFGQGYGEVIGVVRSLGLDLVQVPVRAWAKFIHGDMDKGIPAKKRTLQAILELYPNVSLLRTKQSKVPFDGFVDSLAIAHYSSKALL